MKATVVYVDSSGHEEIEVNGHRIQYGGIGDRYCYTHQSFDCADELSAEEQEAVAIAE